MDRREDYYAQIKTLEDAYTVGVSESDYTGEYVEESSCLLQVGAEPDLRCVYLSDEQAGELAEALLAYINTPR